MSNDKFFHEADTKTEREHLIELFGNLIKKMEEEHSPDVNIYGLNPKSMQCIYDSLKFAERWIVKREYMLETVKKTKDILARCQDDVEKFRKCSCFEHCGEDIEPATKEFLDDCVKVAQKYQRK